jgi:hypothetical protein
VHDAADALEQEILLDTHADGGVREHVRPGYLSESVLDSPTPIGETRTPRGSQRHGDQILAETPLPFDVSA